MLNIDLHVYACTCIYTDIQINMLDQKIILCPALKPIQNIVILQFFARLLYPS